MQSELNIRYANFSGVNAKEGDRDRENKSFSFYTSHSSIKHLPIYFILLAKDLDDCTI